MEDVALEAIGDVAGEGLLGCNARSCHSRAWQRQWEAALPSPRTQTTRAGDERSQLCFQEGFDQSTASQEPTLLLEPAASASPHTVSTRAGKAPKPLTSCQGFASSRQ